jgi:hypothetical protein
MHVCIMHACFIFKYVFDSHSNEFIKSYADVFAFKLALQFTNRRHQGSTNRLSSRQGSSGSTRPWPRSLSRCVVVCICMCICTWYVSVYEYLCT